MKLFIIANSLVTPTAGVQGQEKSEQAKEKESIKESITFRTALRSKNTRRCTDGTISSYFLTKPCPEGYAPLNNPHRKDFSWDHLSLSLGTKFLSRLSKRGAQFYNSYQFLPIVAVDLFNPNLVILGRSLSYKQRVHPHVLLRTNLSLDATGDSPLYETDEEFDQSSKRETTHELDLIAEFGRPESGELTLELSQDLKAHKGFYVSAQGRLVLHNIQFKRHMIQPSLRVTVGGGSEDHNHYLYGEGSGGFQTSHLSYSFIVTVPPTIDHAYPILEVVRSQLVNQARRGGLVQEQSNDWKIIFIAAFRAF